MSASLERLCKAIALHSESKGVEQVPPGWHTAAEIGKRINKHPNTATRQMQALLRTGVVQIRKFKIMTTRGPFPVAHYKINETTQQERGPSGPQDWPSKKERKGVRHDRRPKRQGDS